MSVCPYLAGVIRQANRFSFALHYIVIRDLSVSTTCSPKQAYVINGTIFEVPEYKTVF